MTQIVDAYFSFRSPYSYLATPGLLNLQKDFNITLNLRPVLPLAVRQPDFFSPYIYWLTELGIEAQRRGRGVEFAYEVSHMLFGGTKAWDKGEYLSEAADRAGLDLAEMEKARKDGDHAQEIEANQQALEDAHHWGVPTMVYKGEPFFGEDRIGTLRWRLEKLGLKKLS